MKKNLSIKKVIVFFISIVFTNFIYSNEVLPDNVTFWSDYPNEVLAKTIVDRMTPEELYSQILMFGWAGAEPENLLYQWVNRGLGSV